MLCRAVSAAAAGGADAIARAAEESVPGDIDDDMAILVARSLPAELDARERVFPAEPVMVSEARRMALQTFRAWGMDGAQAELACLLVSEVVTNAVLHTSAATSPRREFGDIPVGAVAAPTASLMPWDVPLPVAAAGPAGVAAAVPKDFAMRLRRGSAAVWVEVCDPDMRLPRIRSAEESDEGGRGLYLVEQLAARWGSRPTRNGKAVWFEMPIDGQSS
jgi:anti-sigma regulatory factor (Ser/Thr protein kinase)